MVEAPGDDDRNMAVPYDVILVPGR